MHRQSWSYLKPNDIVDIIAPASYIPDVRFQAGLEWIESLGLIPRYPADLIRPDLYFAAPLEIQLDHFKKALYSDSRAIWCLRGGYGSMRLIPHLLKLRPPKKPKLFIGFSDITSLHIFLTQNWNWPVIHGRTISQMNLELGASPDRKFLKEIIFGRKTQRTFKKLVALNDSARKEGMLSGSMTGGNLRIIQSSVGTPWEIKAKGKILFLEDIGERGYSIDRMLEQLIQAQIIHRGLKAMVFGDFTNGAEKDGNDLTIKAMERFAEKVKYPVLRGLPAGHGAEENFPMPFNTRSKIILGKKLSLTCSYGGK